MEPTSPDPTLLERVRYVVRHQTDVEETPMSGGVAFAVDGQTVCAVIGDDLLVRRPADDGNEPAAASPAVPAAADVVDDGNQSAAESAGLIPIDRHATRTTEDVEAALDSALSVAAVPPEWPSPAWLQVMQHPRRSLRAIVAIAPGHRVFTLWAVAALLGAMTRWLERWADTGRLIPSAEGPAMFLAAAVVGVPLGLIIGYGIFYIYAEILTFVGNKLGGVAFGEQVRTVVGWSFVPSIIGNLAILITLVFALVVTPFLGDPADAGIVLTVAAFALLIVGSASIVLNVVAFIWQVVIVVAGYSEVNRFSVGRSILALIIPHAVLLLAVFGCVFAFAFSGAF